jgi:Vitamin K-dependent gamma-carboxylase
VKLSSLIESWNNFYFSPQSPVPICLFRILYGGMVILTLLLLRADWLNWYGAHAWVSLPTMLQVEPGARLNLFTVLPQSDEWAQALFWVFLGSAILLTVGFLTRINNVIVFVCLASIQQRNLYITHGGDTFLRIAGFFLMFAPAGAAVSVDRLVRIWRGKEDVTIRPCSPWAQRMIQFELAILYFATFCWKAQGTPWVEGTALSYVYQLNELRRFPLPSWFLHPVVLRFASWLTLFLEFSLGILIWVKDLRYYFLATGLLFHLLIEYSLNIPMFEWDILSAYVLFVDASDLTWVWSRISRVTAGWIGRPLTVFYDGQSARSRRLSNLLRALDVFRCLRFIDVRASKRKFEIHAGAHVLEGMEALRALAVAIPLLWPLAVPLAFHGRWRHCHQVFDRIF